MFVFWFWDIDEKWVTIHFKLQKRKERPRVQAPPPSSSPPPSSAGQREKKRKRWERKEVQERTKHFRIPHYTFLAIPLAGSLTHRCWESTEARRCIRGRVSWVLSAVSWLAVVRWLRWWRDRCPSAFACTSALTVWTFKTRTGFRYSFFLSQKTAPVCNGYTIRVVNYYSSCFSLEIDIILLHPVSE